MYTLLYIDISIQYYLIDCFAHCSWQSENQSGVLTCSALKKVYRQVLLEGTSTLGPENHSSDKTTTNDNISKKDLSAELLGDSKLNRVVFVYLKGTQEFISGRLSARSDHFMSPALLQSQFDTLEEPGDDEDHIDVSVDQTLEQQVIYVTSKLSLH